MLAHQHGVVSGRPERFRVGTTAHARLSDLHETVGNGRPHAHSPLVVDGKRHEVALVDPDHPRAGGKGQIKFPLVMDLHEGIDVDFPRNLEEATQLLR